MINKDTKQRAMDYYVDYGYSTDKIFDLLEKTNKVSKSTLNNWAQNGNWKQLRENKVSQRESYIETLYDFTITIMNSLKSDYNNGKNIDKSAVAMLNTLLGKAEKLINLEIKKRTVEKEMGSEESIPPEVAAIPEVAAALNIVYEAIRKYKNAGAEM